LGDEVVGEGVHDEGTAVTVKMAASSLNVKCSMVALR
jgi:hypothetical protein